VTSSREPKASLYTITTNEINTILMTTKNTNIKKRNQVFVVNRARGPGENPRGITSTVFSKFHSDPVYGSDGHQLALVLTASSKLQDCCSVRTMVSLVIVCFFSMSSIVLALSTRLADHPYHLSSILRWHATSIFSRLTNKEFS